MFVWWEDDVGVALSDDERARLAEVEWCLLSEDPGFAGRLDPDEVARVLRRRAELAWLGLAVGSLMLFLGVAAIRGPISLGVVAAVGGLVLTVASCVVVVQNRRFGPDWWQLDD